MGPPARNGKKMAKKWILAPPGKRGKMAQKMGNLPFLAHSWANFPTFRPFFPLFFRWGQNPFFGHFFPISGRRPDLGSVQGNRDRNPWIWDLQELTSFLKTIFSACKKFCCDGTSNNKTAGNISDSNGTVVAEMITELIRFEPGICICNGNESEFKRESVSVMSDLLPNSHGSVSVMAINSSGRAILYL